MQEQKRNLQISLFVILCILLNLGGKVLAQKLQLPVWMDSFGTVLAAYTLGPVCGAIVGVSVNVIYGLLYSFTHIIYGLISMALGVIVGICAKKGYLDYLFGVLSVGFLLTLLSVAAGTTLNYIFFDGTIGNVWGDGIREFLCLLGWNPVLSHITGEFYMEFSDKVLTLFALFVIVKIAKQIKNKRERRKRNAGQTVANGLALLFVSLFVLNGSTVSAAPIDGSQPSDPMDYNTYIQTVYDSDAGLPGGVANDIAQTKDGVLWIGTYSGLYRYTGSSFRLMDEFDSVKNVNCLYMDEAGRMWIGTNDSGLSICINERISNVVDEEAGLPSDSVRCITQSANGKYYVGTTDSMVIVDITGGLRVTDTFDEIVYANSVAADQN